MTLDQEPKILYAVPASDDGMIRSHQGWFKILHDALSDEGIKASILIERGLVGMVRTGRQYRGIIIEGHPVRPIDSLISGVKDIYPQIPVLISLDYVSLYTVRWAFKSKANDIIEKNYDRSSIIARLRENGIF